MKKIFSIGFVLIMAVGLTACGETQEEKNQKKLLGDGFKMLMDVGKMAQDGASEGEIGDKLKNGVLDSLSGLKGPDGETLSKDELGTLREGMDKGAGLIKEMGDVIKKAEKSGKSDQDISMDFFGKIVEMQLEHDEDMTDEEREGAKAAVEMFKDGGKKFKEGQQKMIDQMKEETKKMHKDMKEAKAKDLKNALTELKRNPKIALIALDGSTLASNMMAPKIGCDDMIIFKELNEAMMPKEILETLFKFDDFDENEGYYNVFYNSKLVVEELSINNNGIATVKLSGNLYPGGICDNPRIIQQIVKTVMVMKPMVIKDVEVFINGEDIGDFLSEKDDEDIDTEIEGEDTSINPIDSFSECEELPDSILTQGNPRTCTTSYGATFTYDALVDDPYVYEAPPQSAQSFILTHNGKMWEDVCFENLGDPTTIDILVEKRKDDVLDDELSFLEYGATITNVEFVDTCPAKYDVSCEYEDKDISFELHFDSNKPNEGDVSATEETGNLKYRASFSPTSYDTTDEKGFIRASCLFQGHEVQGLEGRLNSADEWK